jgi:RNA polymerase sigma factor (sigma-70 family)
MNVHFSYRVHKSSDLEKDLNHFLQKLQKRLQVFRPELIHLKGIVEQNSPREGFTVALNLRLPSGQMAVQESAPTAAAALKAAFDGILQQTNKHKELLRSSHKWERNRRTLTTRRAPAQVPFESTLAAVQPSSVSAEDIRSYVNVNLARLERFVERELVFRETAGQVAADSITKEEVVDEAIARALGNGGEKPDRLTLEPWLYRQALRAMEEFCFRSQEETASVPLEGSARKPNVRASDEPELQYHQPDESLTGESVIPDRRLATPEDIADNDEMIALVQLALGKAKRIDREAFILHGIEGFSPEEIADITDRSLEDVRSSIATAREQVRRSEPLANRFKRELGREIKASSR